MKIRSQDLIPFPSNASPTPPAINNLPPWRIIINPFPQYFSTPFSFQHSRDISYPDIVPRARIEGRDDEGRVGGSSRKAPRRIAFLISSGKINSVSRNENSVRSLSLSLHIRGRSSILCARSEEERSRRKPRIGFDSWGARPGIFLIHNRRVTYCHAARGVIEIAPL